MNFYNIERNRENGSYRYIEFESEYGKMSDPMDSFFCIFETAREAEVFGERRGAVYAYDNKDKLKEWALSDKWVYKGDMKDLIKKKREDVFSDNRFLYFKDGKGRDVVLGLNGERPHSINLWQEGALSGFKEFILHDGGSNDLAREVLAETLQSYKFIGQCVLESNGVFPGSVKDEAVRVIREKENFKRKMGEAKGLSLLKSYIMYTDYSEHAVSGDMKNILKFEGNVDFNYSGKMTVGKKFSYGEGDGKIYVCQIKEGEKNRTWHFREDFTGKDLEIFFGQYEKKKEKENVDRNNNKKIKR